MKKLMLTYCDSNGSHKYSVLVYTVFTVFMMFMMSWTGSMSNRSRSSIA